MTWTCHRCGGAIAAVERVGRRDTCQRCGGDLHCCRNCRFYAPGRHNDCSEPQAERQVDKDAGNFCEYFSFNEAVLRTAHKPADARAALDRLFSPGGRRAADGGTGAGCGEPRGDDASSCAERRKT